MTTEYALRAAVYLGESPGKLRTAQHVAETTQVPPRYASRVLQTLVEAGLATSQRGPTGGFGLSKDPQSISLLDVVLAVEPINCVESCPLNLAEHKHELCPLHKKMDDVAKATRASLQSTTLQDVMTQAVVPLGLTGLGARLEKPDANTFPDDSAT